MTVKKWTWLSGLLAALLVLSIGVIGCGDDDEDDDGVSGNPVELARDGWDEFELLNWEAALELFDRSIAAGATSTDAFTGAGWASYMLGDLEAATEYWNDGLDEDRPGDRLDIKVGQAFVAYDGEHFTTCVSLIDEVLTTNPGYRFDHMEGVNELDLIWMMASSYLLTGDFDAALVQVQELNSTFDADLTTQAGRDALIAEIDRLMPIIRG